MTESFGFFGYVLTGGICIVLALWWAVSIFERYFDSVLNPYGMPYKSSAAFARRNSMIPIEALFKLSIMISYILLTVVAMWYSEWSYHDLAESGQHILLYIFFIINSIADLVTF